MQPFTKDDGCLFSGLLWNSMMIFKGELLEDFPGGNFKRCNCLPYYERHSIHLFYGFIFLFFLLLHIRSLKKSSFSNFLKISFRKCFFFVFHRKTFDIKKNIIDFFSLANISFNGNLKLAWIFCLFPINSVNEGAKNKHVFIF